MLKEWGVSRSANGRARGSGETDGFIKVIREKRYSELIGAHIVGGECQWFSIGQFVVGRHLETTVEEMTTAVYADPDAVGRHPGSRSRSSVICPIHI